MTGSLKHGVPAKIDAMKLTKANARKWQARWAVLAAVEREERSRQTLAQRGRAFRDLLEFTQALAIQQRRKSLTPAALRAVWKNRQPWMTLYASLEKREA
jgi:hypothetical protein